MGKTSWTVYDLQVEAMTTPLAIDCDMPRFSWKLGSRARGTMQAAYEIQVFLEDTGELVWDSGRVEEAWTSEISYQGTALRPRSSYRWTVTAWNMEGDAALAEDRFETGLMDARESAWEPAVWIGAPRPGLCANVKGIFWIEARLRIPEGSCQAGIVFGAKDFRLLDRTKNTSWIQGENYISYELDISKVPARLHIYRVGYHPDDSAQVPFASVELPQGIMDESRHQFHTLAVEVRGNIALAYVDGTLVDYETANDGSCRGRQLNPLGQNDVITFPRLNEIGFTAAPGSAGIFQSLLVRDIRTPKAVLIQEDAECEDSIFAKAIEEGRLERTEEGFLLCAERGRTLVTADPSHTSEPMLRRDFMVRNGAALKRARLYVTARGIYDGYVNGAPLTEDWFTPGASQYDKHIQYQVYDITKRLQPGANAMGFYLASGWWSDAQTYTLMNYNYFGDRPSLLAMLELRYEDGTQEVIGTDCESWRYSGEGPVLYASNFHGEQYDARREAEISAFSTAAYAHEAWSAPARIHPVPIPEEEQAQPWPAPNHTDPEITAQIGPSVGVVDILTAKSMRQPQPGVYIYDLEQNIAGVPKIRLHGRPGQVIRFRYGEIVYPPLNDYGPLAGLILTENLRDASAMDLYICKGEPQGEEFFPKLTFHGFRYVEITGVEEPPALEDVTCAALSSIRTRTGDIQTSDPLVNRLFRNICWSQSANFISIPTDCPQRNERLGWMGDAQVFAKTAGYNADVRHFYSRFLQAARDLQSPEGQYPNIAPVGGGFGGIAWESAGIIVTWETFQQYGDRRIVEENFDACMRYIKYLRSKGEPVLLRKVGPLGDWLASDMSTDNLLIWNAIYAYDVKILAKMARAIDRQEEAKVLENLFQQIQETWNVTFVDNTTGKTRSWDGQINDTQCSYALPLSYGIFTRENAGKAAEHLARRTREVGHKVTTGFLGTAPLNPVLCDYGYSEDAYALLFQTEYPSWLYSVTQGATTIWERWNSYTVEKGFGGNNSMNSFNHYSLGAVGAWLYEYVLGIARDEEAPGFSRFILKPCIQGLAYANGFYESIHGRIESGWERTEGEIRYFAGVPAGTEARLYLPAGDIVENGVTASEAEGIQYLGREGNCCVYSLGSGEYSFTIR